MREALHYRDSTGDDCDRCVSIARIAPERRRRDGVAHCRPRAGSSAMSFAPEFERIHHAVLAQFVYDRSAFLITCRG